MLSEEMQKAPVDFLTIVIPVKNEEKNLPVCLENVREFRHVALLNSGFRGLAG